MFDSLRLLRTPARPKIFSTISFALIILVIFFGDCLIPNVSIRSDVFEHIQTDQTSIVLEVESSTDDGPGYLAPPPFDVRKERILQPENKLKPEDLRLFETSRLARRYDSRIRKFFSSSQCKVQFFMTWISPAESFGEREFFGLDSLFQTNPESCLVILSNSMDSKKGRKILEPLISRGFHVEAISPDLWALFKNTPAAIWLTDIKNGNKDPGKIPLGQNLSNLMRLAVIYKYGGVYLDTDFIILKDLSGLRNSIGAQSADANGNWTRLNNAVLVFDKNHPLIYKFMEEFAHTFDGNKWGHNGPYLVSRVVERVAKTGELKNFTVLPTMAFYPVDWIRISGFFARRNDRVGEKWVEAQIRQLRRSTYGVHLWNKESRRFKIEEGSIIKRLVSDHCVICSSHASSS